MEFGRLNYFSGWGYCNTEQYLIVARQPFFLIQRYLLL